FFQAEDGIRDFHVTGVQTCALPISMGQDGLGPLLVSALVLGLVNAVVRPVMVLLTLPLTVLTLGLFLLVVNALALAVVAAVTPRSEERRVGKEGTSAWGR